MTDIDLSKSKTAWPVAVLMKRGVWTYLLQPLVRWLPKSMSPLRVGALRMMGASIGPHCLILPGVKVLMPWNLHLEDHVAIGAGCDIYNFSPINIGRMSVVSQRSFLCTGSHDFEHPHMPLTHAPIQIGQQCWIAAETFIAPGVRISEGVVVGARSVVTKSLLEPWTIYAGNPARAIKARRIQALAAP